MSSYSLIWEGITVVIEAPGLSHCMERVLRILNLDPIPTSRVNSTDILIEQKKEVYYLTAYFINKTCHFSNGDDLIVNTVNLISTCFLNRSKQSVLHSGALLMNDKAILFSGLPHAGKSTLAVNAWLSGHALINDDLILYNDKTQTVSSFPKPLKPRLPSLEIPKPILKKADASDLCVGSFVHDIGLFIGKRCSGMIDYSQNIPVKALFFIERGQHTKLAPINKMQALTLALLQVLPNESCLKIGALMNYLNHSQALFHLVIGENDQASALQIMETESAH